MNKFGQEVIVSIEGAGGNTILDATGLRVDFDVRLLEGYNRATVTIFNLNNQTIGSMIGGNKENYLSLTTRLHGGQEFKLMDGYFISNVIDEKRLPETITTFYCFDKLRTSVLEKTVRVVVENPTLDSQLRAIMRAAGFNGKITYQNFPSGHTKKRSPRPKTQMSGTVFDSLSDLSDEYNFTYFTKKDEFLIVFKPNIEQVKLTDIDSMPVLKLQTDNMRANPKLGPATIRITSNLDGNISSGAVVDTTQLLTAGVDADEEALQIADDFANYHIVGYSKFQILTVQHVGSNYTDQWHTNAYGISPAQGDIMPTQTWWR